MTQSDEGLESDSGGVDHRLAHHGHVSYLEIPAVEIGRSADFYEAVFGWRIDRRDTGDCSFDDRSGNLIGRWVTGRAVPREPGLLAYVYVDRIDDIVERVMMQGGEVDKPPYPEGDLWVATFRDPAGNLMGIWQAGSRNDGVHGGGHAFDPAGTSIAYSVAPMLSVRNGTRAVEFYKSAFGAIEVYRVEAPDGAVVSRLSVAGAEFWLSDESTEHDNFSPESLGGSSARMILTVPDPDAMFAKALAAGAREVVAVQEAYGWRLGRVVDPFGHHWEIGRPLAP